MSTNALISGASPIARERATPLRSRAFCISAIGGHQGHGRQPAAGSDFRRGAAGDAAVEFVHALSLETNVRSATVLGIVGAGGIGHSLYENAPSTRASAAFSIPRSRPSTGWPLEKA